MTECEEVQQDACEEVQKEPVREQVYFGDEEISDVTLVVGELDIHVHKMVLAARSDVFKVMFYGSFAENGASSIEIKDVCPVAFRRLMEFMYLGRIADADTFLPSCAVGRAEYLEGSKKFWKEASALMAVADRFNIPFIRPYMERKISSKEQDHSEHGGRCWECLDGFLLAMCHDLDVRQAKKQYYVDEVIGWADNFGRLMPEYLSINIQKMQQIFKQLM